MLDIMYMKRANLSYPNRNTKVEYFKVDTYKNQIMYVGDE